MRSPAASTATAFTPGPTVSVTCATVQATAPAGDVEPTRTTPVTSNASTENARTHLLIETPSGLGVAGADSTPQWRHGDDHHLHPHGRVDGRGVGRDRPADLRAPGPRRGPGARHAP